MTGNLIEIHVPVD